MEKQETTVKERLKAYLSENNISMAEFSRRIGVSPAYITSMRKSIQPDKVERIKEEFPDLDIDWLLTGIKDSPPPDSDTRLVPIGSLDSKGGVEYNESVNTTGYITGYMPFSKTMAHEGDIVIPVYGHSMEPVYNDGCMVLIRKVEMWREYLELGCTYIVELMDDRRVIKTVTAGSDNEHFLLTSFNPAYPPQEVSRSFVRSVWRVIASIRRESL